MNSNDVMTFSGYIAQSTQTLEGMPDQRAYKFSITQVTVTPLSLTSAS